MGRAAGRGVPMGVGAAPAGQFVGGGGYCVCLVVNALQFSDMPSIFEVAIFNLHFSISFNTCTLLTRVDSTLGSKLGLKRWLFSPVVVNTNHQSTDQCRHIPDNYDFKFVFDLLLLEN